MAEERGGAYIPPPLLPLCKREGYVQYTGDFLTEETHMLHCSLRIFFEGYKRIHFFFLREQEGKLQIQVNCQWLFFKEEENAVNRTRVCVCVDLEDFFFSVVGCVTSKEFNFIQNLKGKEIKWHNSFPLDKTQAHLHTRILLFFYLRE
jgi:hypothetical protein